MGKYVFATEGNNEILGEYLGTDGDVVMYARCASDCTGSAPADCVEVREVTRAEICDEFERFIRRIQSARQLVVGGGFGDTGLNSLVAIGVEMTRYAHVMGAALSTDEAARDVNRKVAEGHFIEARAHSRALEAAAV